MRTDDVLIQQVEELLCGETCHFGANLIGAYRSAAREALETGDGEYDDIAREAECSLRILLTNLRLRRAGYLVQWQ